MKKSTKIANSLGLVTLTQLRKLTQTTERTVYRLHLNTYQIPEYKRRFYSLLEAKAAIGKWLTIKPIHFSFTKICIHCKNEFKYSKTIECSGWREKYIIENPDCSQNNRTWCGFCELPRGEITEQVKHRMSVDMRNWWENISPQKRTAMRIKCSKKKKEWWAKKNART